MRKIGLVFLTLVIFLNLATAQENPATKEKAIKPTVKINGRIMYDLEFHKIGDETLAGQEFRRLRLAASGTIHNNIQYKAEFDFAGAKIGFRDIYIKLGKLPKIGGSLKIGSFTEPTGLNQMTSSKYITFFERSQLTHTQPFKYNSGFMYENYKMLGGKIGLALAYTFNGDKNVGFLDKEINRGGNFIGRVTTAVINNKEKHRIVHLGVNFETRENPNDQYKFSSRPEVHFGDKLKLEVLDMKSQSDVGFELGTTFGSLSIQGEYESVNVDAVAKDYKMSTYYGFVSYFLTGEHRPYKNASFSRVKPKNNFSSKGGGWGAIELVARVSSTEYTDFVAVGEPDKRDIVSLGFNWYFDPYTRLTYNYVTSDTSVSDKLHAHLFRFQVDF